MTAARYKNVTQLILKNPKREIYGNTRWSILADNVVEKCEGETVSFVNFLLTPF